MSPVVISGIIYSYSYYCCSFAAERWFIRLFFSDGSILLLPRGRKCLIVDIYFLLKKKEEEQEAEQREDIAKSFPLSLSVFIEDIFVSLLLSIRDEMNPSMEPQAFGAGRTGSAFDPIEFIKKPQVILRLVAWVGNTTIVEASL